MFSAYSSRFFLAGLVVSLLCAGVVRSAWAQDQNPESSTATVTVVVKDSVTNEPIAQARLTLQFSEPGSIVRFRVPKKHAYSAKTNAQGRYKFTNINKGTIHLLVTADRHQSFGKEYDLEKDNQVIEVKLKRPQPLL
jgi:hypothetical protein